MRLRNGDPFDILGHDREEITFTMTDGTVDHVITNLDHVQKILNKGESLRFSLAAGQTRRLLVTYVFKAARGESYETRVIGDPGEDESVDQFQQVPGMADQDRRYKFEA